MENIVSERIKQTPPSFIRGILKAAESEDVISFAGGLPNPISFPQEALKESMDVVYFNMPQRRDLHHYESILRKNIESSTSWMYVQRILLSQQVHSRHLT